MARPPSATPTCGCSTSARSPTIPDSTSCSSALPDLPEAELVIAGGPDHDDLDSDIAYKKLGKLAAGLGVADRVTFAGHVTGKTLPALMRSADIFVSAARYEPFGAAAISAMACGKPVVGERGRRLRRRRGRRDHRAAAAARPARGARQARCATCSRRR